ncbi:MAG: hydroxysqualene dehydroxylase HpnE [bacterium]|jgi:squalene-associated FAD-dependent desaturase
MGHHTVIIGGGFAGIAAAVQLAQAGIRVTLLETKSFLGGRTYSIRDRKSGDVIDNGQHILMGCYHQTMELLRMLGTQDGIYFQDRLSVYYRDGEENYDELNCPALPGPLHLLGGLLRMKSLTLQDKWAAVRMGLALKNPASVQDSESVDAFCNRLRQTPAIREKMWDPIAISALNETTERADMKIFREVLAQAFFGSADDSRLGLPRVPLQELHGEAARRFIEERGGLVRLNERVERILCQGALVKGVILTTGERIPCESCISAASANHLKTILEHSALAEQIAVPDLGASPIVSVYLWFEEPLATEAVCCTPRCTFEWIFHRNHFVREGEHEKQCVCLVASAARRFQSWSREQIIEAAIADLHRLYPHSRRQKALSATVFWEPRATFSATPENVRKRLPSQTVLPNFFLAGDWTDTGLPATIEGAVQSGFMAAELLLRSGY